MIELLIVNKKINRINTGEILYSFQGCGCGYHCRSDCL